MYIDLVFNPPSAFSGKADEIVKEPKIITVNKFNEESATDFNKDFSEALQTGQPIIPIVIDSYGGEVYSLFNMIDTIKSSPVDVATIVKGKCMSCGAVLLSAGTKGMRYASANSTILIHEVSSASFGKNEEIQSDADHTKMLNKKLFQMLSTNCEQSKTYFEKIYRDEKARADWYLDAKEAKSHNLINHIGIPKLQVEIKATVSLI